MNWRHFHLSVDENQWAWIAMDKENKSVNAICPEFLAELESVIAYLEGDNRYEKVIFTSKKKGSYIVGADLEAVATMGPGPSCEQFIRKGQEVFRRLELLPIQTVAVIQGYCFGGGLEFALACHQRIAIETPKTKLGFPEVMLGIQPGWGGSVRSMRYGDPLKAFDLILSGRTITARKAKQYQLVDAVIPERLLHNTLAAFNQQGERKQTVLSKVLNTPWARKLISYFLLKKLKRKVSQEYYPAPFAMVHNWLEVGHSCDRAYEKELESIIALIKTTTATNLFSVFFLKEALKKQIKSTQQLKHLHVVGSGVMGGDIALWAAYQGMKVTVQDLDAQSYQSMAKRISVFAKKKFKKKSDRDKFTDKIILDLHGFGLKTCDIVIEAVSENLELKRKILQDIEKKCQVSTIIATNTSTLPLEDIDEIFQVPERFIGVHFFNPVPRMPLVEIVIGQKTSPEIVEKSLAFVGQIQKLPLKVKSCPGFLVNRVLLPYLLEAVKIHQEGVPLEVIDKAAEKFGFPMGPVELVDTVGLDVTVAALSSLKGTEAIPALVQKKIQAGHLGKKTSQGFYQYKKNRPVKEKITSTHQIYEVEQRLILSLCNEAVAAWSEGVVSSLEELNAASIFGFGFPPFRGGVIAYIQEQGPDEIRSKLVEHHQKFGDRFLPCQAFERLVQEKKDHQVDLADL